MEIWDAAQCSRVRSMGGHTARVGCMAWNENILTSGSRDRFIHHRDIRCAEDISYTLEAHQQEIW